MSSDEFSFDDYDKSNFYEESQFAFECLFEDDFPETCNDEISVDTREKLFDTGQKNFNNNQKLFDTGQTNICVQNYCNQQNLNLKHGKEFSMFKNNSFELDEDFSSRVFPKTQRRKINLNSQAQYLKNHYYLIFTNKKKFSKTIVKKIHNIIEGPLNIGPFTRKMTRFNDLYFEENAQNCDKILQYLVMHKEEIISKIPELKNLQ